MPLANLKPIETRTLREQTVDELKTLIISGQLGKGERLTETGLAKALGISRGPLREAIRDLVEMGLLVSKPYTGIFVRGVTKRDIEELYSLRLALEKFAFQECWGKRTKANLEDLRARNLSLTSVIDDGCSPQEAIERELVLHSWCYEVSDHSLLQKSWSQLRPNLSFYFTIHQQAHARSGPQRDAHDNYVSLACGGDLDAMLEHLTHHMRQGMKQALTALPEE
ncbi:hypothetical protein RA19_02630 [Leisingera sp. ANG-M1]|uniref:GntR family transcriptional regulator n=1 Tax=Leisingera sp. ANG-M1 TaxID=1577895 RepID=UPI00057C81B9|nr:GntR family transcriptional regulator [Leisingera sp. ANG-M1]KIC12162.1 hypothetical protein RA19_02630 [Leisingera sp. ANG-M1]